MKRFDGRASRVQRKKLRQERIDSIVVEVVREDGTVLRFDGDEESQKRLDRFGRRAVVNGVETVAWTMSDNTVMDVTPLEMEQALDLALQVHGERWHIDSRGTTYFKD